MNKSKWYRIAYERGANEAIDCFPKTDWMGKSDCIAIADGILGGIEDSDPRVMDLCRSPLSGEWAGESLKEIFGRMPSESTMENYETGFSDGFFGQLAKMAKAEKARFA